MKTGKPFTEERRAQLKKIFIELSPNARPIMYRGVRYKSIRDLYHRHFFLHSKDYYTFHVRLSYFLKTKKENGKDKEYPGID